MLVTLDVGKLAHNSLIDAGLLLKLKLINSPVTFYQHHFNSEYSFFLVLTYRIG